MSDEGQIHLTQEAIEMLHTISAAISDHDTAMRAAFISGVGVGLAAAAQDAKHDADQRVFRQAAEYCTKLVEMMCTHVH